MTKILFKALLIMVNTHMLIQTVFSPVKLVTEGAPVSNPCCMQTQNVVLQTMFYLIHLNKCKTKHWLILSNT